MPITVITDSKTSIVHFPGGATRATLRDDSTELAFECQACLDYLDFDDQVLAVRHVLKHSVGGRWQPAIHDAAALLIAMAGVEAGLSLYAEQTDPSTYADSPRMCP